MNLTKSKNISAMKLLIFDIETCLRSGGWRISCKINKYLDLSFKNSNLKIPTPKPYMRKFVIYSQIMLVNTSCLSYLLMKSGAVVTFFSTTVKGNDYIGLLLLHEYHKNGCVGIGPKPPMTCLI